MSPFKGCLHRDLVLGTYGYFRRSPPSTVFNDLKSASFASPYDNDRVDDRAPNLHPYEFC
jgi:hypothetical protein